MSLQEWEGTTTVKLGTINHGEAEEGSNSNDKVGMSDIHGEARGSSNDHSQERKQYNILSRARTWSDVLSRARMWSNILS